MNSPSDDDMFSRYRTELVMDADARARTFRKLQERVLRGEQPAPEIDVLPPQTAALRGLWSLPAKWIVTIAGLGVGALIVANVALRGTPLTAAKVERGVVEQLMAADSGAALAHDSRSGRLADAETGAVQRAENAGAEGALRAHAKTAVRSSGPRATTELTKRVINAAPAPMAAAREAGASLSASQKRTSASASVVRAQSSPIADDNAAQPGASEPVDGLQPSDAAANANQQKLAYTAPKVPQRSDKEIASETLTKEVQLLQAAQLALRAGDTQRSLALLAEHTWTYPQGHLAEARDVARILALCQAGNVAQSKLHAKRFLQQRPESPYALRVRAGCAAMTEASDPRRESSP